MPMDITNISKFYHMFCQNNCKIKKVSTLDQGIFSYYAATPYAYFKI